VQAIKEYPVPVEVGCRRAAQARGVGVGSALQRRGPHSRSAAAAAAAAKSAAVARGAAAVDSRGVLRATPPVRVMGASMMMPCGRGGSTRGGATGLAGGASTASGLGWGRGGGLEAKRASCGHFPWVGWQNHASCHPDYGLSPGSWPARLGAGPLQRPLPRHQAQLHYFDVGIASLCSWRHGLSAGLLIPAQSTATSRAPLTPCCRLPARQHQVAPPLRLPLAQAPQSRPSVGAGG
jgi:hypothetical protein